MTGARLNRRYFMVSTIGMLSATAARAAAVETETPSPDPRSAAEAAPVSTPQSVPVSTPQSAPSMPPDAAAAQNTQPMPAAPQDAAAARNAQPVPAAQPDTAAAQNAPAAVVQEARPAGKTLPTPKGKVILSISGKISVTNAANNAARFDREMLEGLGLTKFTTMTPWYNEPVTFEGVRLDRLMEVVGAAGEQLRARALDDYTTEIPIADFERYHTILAMKRNGNYLPVTDKGPLFIVYPFDSHPDLKHQRFYARSAWQVARMTVT